MSLMMRSNLVSVMPMAKPRDTIYYIKVVYGNKKENYKQLEFDFKERKNGN